MQVSFLSSCFHCIHFHFWCCFAPAVAAAYDPIADAKVPSAKSALKPTANGAGRKMLQTQLGLFGPVYVGAPFW